MSRLPQSGAGISVAKPIGKWLDLDESASGATRATGPSIALANGERRSAGGVTVRWIDPDSWGCRAWSVLFAIARRVERESNLMNAWYDLVRQLPDCLPCHTCRCCCAKFIKRQPPEKQTPVIWLCDLRNDVFQRNLKSADCNRLDRCMFEEKPPCSQANLS